MDNKQIKMIELDSKQRSNGQKGFSLVEILIAMAVLSIGLLSIAAMQMSAIDGNADSNNLTERTTLGSNHVEYLLNLPYDHPDLDQTTVGNPRTTTKNGNTYSWMVTDVSANEKTISLTVITSHYGKNKTVTLGTKKVR